MPSGGSTRDEEKVALRKRSSISSSSGAASIPRCTSTITQTTKKSALRRLAQEHTTREDEVDKLLRGEVLVDLFAVVRQSLAISEDGYGLKKLERFYDLARGTEIKKGDESIVMFERWIAEPDQRILDEIEAYNRDDCRSTQLLRDWLLERRAEAVARSASSCHCAGPSGPTSRATPISCRRASSA